MIRTRMSNLPRRRSRLGVTALLGLSALLAVAGCSAVPSTGPVHQGLSDLHQAEQLVQFNPLGPVVDSTKEDIVRGFVLAATSSAGDYAVAREFLTPEYAGQWDPAYGVLIDDGSRPYREDDDDDAAVLELTATAKVDADGMLLPVAPGGSTDMRFELERVNGQWRIASAPAGIILDRATFTAIWSAHQIYFIGPTGVLIPETRWFQSRAALSTEIVNALLEGPGERVAGVVHSGFPPGTELVTGAVTVVDGVARIELSQEVLEAGEQAAKEMFRQLHQSMRTVTGVNGFEVVVDGVEVREPDAGETQPSVPPAEPSNPAVMIGDQFGTVVAGEFVATERLGDAIVSLGPDAVVLSPDESAAAVRNGEGISRVDDEVTRLVDQRGGLLVPSFDPMGYIWTLPAGGGELRVTGGVDETYTVEAPWLRELTPAAISVSPDGARLAVLVPAEGNRSVVYTAGIVREANGAPVRTTATVDAQLWASGNPIDIDWVDTLRFATLTESGNTSKVTVGGPGLFAAEQGSVAGGDQIASGGSRTQLRVLSGDGDLYMSQGSGWQRLIGDVEVLAKRG